MRVQALWYGGENYSAPNPAHDLEDFATLAAAKDAFASYADHDPYRPCVEDSEMHVYFGAYSENGPDRVLTLGRRGGVKVSK